jgi:hypothetical protein
MPMTDIKKARHLFQDAGLALPDVPKELAARLKEQSEWVFSTRKIVMSPYNLQHYLTESEESQVDDYVVLAHSGHGVNSYAIQYYLVQGSLRMFLHLGWGGAYMNPEETAAMIRDCFSMADRIVTATQCVARLQTGGRLLVVGSDFYGSHWLRPGESVQGEESDGKQPLEVLTEAHDWLASLT